MISTIEKFYSALPEGIPANFNKRVGHFDAMELGSLCGSSTMPMTYSRKDFYKVTFLDGKKRFHYADKVIDVEGKTLMFTNPSIPYKMEHTGDLNQGYFCIFTEPFFNDYGNLKEYPVFQPYGNPVFMLNEEQADEIQQIFKKMIAEKQSDYAYKNDVLRTLVFELIHSAMKLQPSALSSESHSNASARISDLFLELLERQFPIESVEQQMTLRAPKEFASQLAVHVNHLNRALKETSGKTTSQIIAERVLQEAKTLLRHTNWNINEISWCLGFEELSAFIHFFKKHLAVTPRSFREEVVV
jgi:AraC family transcriptional activator of pobA